MKKIVVLIAIIALSLFTMGMGGLGGTPEGSIPIPNEDFKATVTDVNDVKTECSFVSIDGKDFLKGKRGAASVTIPFEKIKSIAISITADERDVDAELKLKDDSSIKLKMDGNTDLFGKTDFGTIQIKIREISLITFNSQK